MLSDYIVKHNRLQDAIFDKLINPAEQEVKEIRDWKEQSEEIGKINMIVDYCNYTNQLLVHMQNIIHSAPTQSELHQLRQYKRMADKYIRLLGGNPSLLTFIKETDL